MAKRQHTNYLQKTEKDGTNKKALIWVGAIFAVIVVGMALLLVFNR